MDNLIERIVMYRAKNSMSQVEFAKKCRVSTQTICNIENGYQEANKITLIKIEQVLNEKE